MDPLQTKAFDFAQETTKQLISLSTGTVALTITFGQDFFSQVPPSAKVWAVASWVGFLLAVVFGVWALMAMTGSLDGKGREREPSVYDRNIMIPVTLQVFSFLAAVVLVVIFAIHAVL